MEPGTLSEMSTSCAFRDHEAAVYNRCEDLLCAVPPAPLMTRQAHNRNRTRNRSNSNSNSNSTSGCDDGGKGLEAAAIVAKMVRCREDLFPALWRMGRSYSVMGTAIKEMEALKGNLRRRG